MILSLYILLICTTCGLCLQSLSANHRHVTRASKSKTQKSKSPKRVARSDGEGSPPATHVKKSKKKKVASAERTPSSDRGSKSKDAVASDTEDKRSLSADLQPVEVTKAALSSYDASKPSVRVTLRSSVVSASSPKRTVGPRTPPGPEPMSVSFIVVTCSSVYSAVTINKGSVFGDLLRLNWNYSGKVLVLLLPTILWPLYRTAGISRHSS